MVNLNPISSWRDSSNKEKRACLIGLLIGILLMVPMLAMEPEIPRSMSYISTVIKDPILYNSLYLRYCEETGNATSLDVAIVINPLVDNATYKNMAVTVISYSDDTLIRYICFIDSNDAVIEKVTTPAVDEKCTIQNTNDINSVVIFLYSTILVYTIELWIW